MENRSNYKLRIIEDINPAYRLWRGKRLSGEWVYGSLVINKGEYFIEDDKGNKNPVDRETVGQAIHNSNHNINEILFHGDLVQSGNNVFCLLYATGSYGYVLYKVLANTHYETIDFYWHKTLHENCSMLEKIGNVWDDKDKIPFIHKCKADVKVTNNIVDNLFS